ncbi:MAG: chromosome segregation protein SMC [bacterium]
MYLKSIQMVGFKSFAHSTVLAFEPGMTAIVGPNGCGKSNVSDAVRWVLGETSAKALRGSKMEDCIFNGTDTRKPVGMAEVSITFADCETTLGTDYHEVTVTRRVFRSGEGQYFMNKTPCRLKDIQRLFMDTGIGTSSYSLMEQGRIDQVLSSRPEDRREIFEEASGITRFKADKKEALRKLDQTEANLLRLDDVVREVKRQIGSLQRQAGKARRYKELRDQLRTFDTFWTGRKLQQMDVDLQQIETRIAEFGTRLQSLHEEVQTSEARSAAWRSAVSELEARIGEATEERAAAQTRLEHNHELIRINAERIQELQSLAERDQQDSGLATAQAAQQKAALEELTSGLVQAEAARDQLAGEARIKSEALSAHEAEVEDSRRQIQGLRTTSMHLDHSISQLQNQLTQLEARQQATIMRRERLGAEHAQIARVANENETQLGGIAGHLGSLQEELARRETCLEELLETRQQRQTEIEALRKACGEIQSLLAVKKAQIEILEADDSSAKDFPEGARLILDGANPLGLNTKAVLGALANHIQIEPTYRTALEAVLRAWLDAVVITDSAGALSILKELQTRKAGSARLVTDTGAPIPERLPAPEGARPLFALTTCTPFARTTIERLLANIFVVESLDRIPSPMPEGTVFVTFSGIVARATGAFEYWTADARASNPLTRRHQLADLHEGIEDQEASLSSQTLSVARLNEELAGLARSIQEATTRLTEQRRAVALKEGEFQVVSHEAGQAKHRLEVVSKEIEELRRQSGGDEERQDFSRRIAEARAQQTSTHERLETLTHTLQEMEGRRTALQAEATDSRVRYSEARQSVEHMTSQREPLSRRLDELGRLISSRSESLSQYARTIEQLTQATSTAQSQLSSLQANVAALTEKLDLLRGERTEKARELTVLDSGMAAKRGAMEEIRDQKSAIEVRNAESRMRRQNLIDRATSEWGLSLEGIMQSPIPTWEGEVAPGGEPPYEATINELRTKIEAMGPVNLVAIEEYQELEERYAFLTGQQQDLVSAKAQLVEMIKKINGTTSELFAQTFQRINENFQIMFERLFNGGSAKLVMVTEEDVLESGIDIIARPPGKRLQSVSLMSGGERTMTAVALLFAIYMIKPSPFCLLDELDAALDESNIGRFVKVLADFLAQSQFIVITHNRRTIGAANVIYGVTMQETGISKVVSMKFSEYEQNKEFQQNTRKPTPAAP